MQFSYPARLDREAEGDVVVSFRDIPEALTGAMVEAEALELAPDALATAVDFYLDQGREVPAPSALEPGEVSVPLDPALAARVLLQRSMASQGITGRGLAKKLGKDEKTVRQMLAGKGATLNATLAALRALGVRPTLAA